jgi:hypothetical protein
MEDNLPSLAEKIPGSVTITGNLELYLFFDPFIVKYVVCVGKSKVETFDARDKEKALKFIQETIERLWV